MKSLRPYSVTSDNEVRQFATLEAAMLYVARLISVHKQHVAVSHPNMAPIIVMVQKSST